MKHLTKIFIAGGAFCLFILNAKAASCDACLAPADLVSQDGHQVVETRPVANSSTAPSTLPTSGAFPVDTAVALPEAIALPESPIPPTEQPLAAPAERHEIPLPAPQTAPTGFQTLLEMGADVIIKAFHFSESTRSTEFKCRRYTRDSNVFFILNLASGWQVTDDNYNRCQFFIIAAKEKEAMPTFNAVERFKRELGLTLPNQIKIVSFDLYDSEVPATPFHDRLYSIVPKRNILSFVLADNVKGKFVLLKDLCVRMHWKEWPGIRVIVPSSDRGFFTEEILRDMYERVLRQWHSRIDTIDLGVFANESEAAERMLDVIGQPPPSASRWNIFSRTSL